MIAKYVYGAKCFKKLNFELLHFTVSLLTAGWHPRKVVISVSWHLAHGLVSQFIDCLVGWWAGKHRSSQYSSLDSSKDIQRHRTNSRPNQDGILSWVTPYYLQNSPLTTLRIPLVPAVHTCPCQHCIISLIQHHLIAFALPKSITFTPDIYCKTLWLLQQDNHAFSTFICPPAFVYWVPPIYLARCWILRNRSGHLLENFKFRWVKI